MILTILSLLGITTVAIMAKDRYRIPLPISILPMAYGVSVLTDHALIDVDAAGFDALLLALLPILIATDVLAIRFDDVRKHALSLFYMAVIAVLLSVFVGAWLGSYVFSDYGISFLYLILMFAMITATDPVAVVNVMGSSKLPHELSFLAEGESLANDAVVLVLFGICVSVINASGGSGESHSLLSVVAHAGLAVPGAIVVGAAVGILGLALLSLTTNKIAETALFLVIAYAAFEVAEIFHWSGILAVIVAVMTANTLVTRRLNSRDIEIETDEKLIRESAGKNGIRLVFEHLEMAIQDRSNHESIKEFIGFLAILGTVVLFVSMLSMVHLSVLLDYVPEILITFVIVTLARMVMTFKFGFVSNTTNRMRNINLRWWSILSLAGVKGGLSILMLHMLPPMANADHQTLFEAVVVGNILLSTFVYPPLMMAIIHRYRDRFEEEAVSEAH